MTTREASPGVDGIANVPSELKTIIAAAGGLADRAEFPR